MINRLIKKVRRGHPSVVKDKVLGLLMERDAIEVTEIWSEISNFGEDETARSPAYIDILCQQLSDEGFVRYLPIEGSFGLILLLDKGRIFIHWEGGYTSRLQTATLNNLWIGVKIIAGIFNASAIIILTYKSVQVSDKSNKLEAEKEVAVKSAEKFRVGFDSLSQILTKIKHTDSLKHAANIQTKH